MHYFINKNRKRAFSLVEILVTLLVISILLIVVSPVLIRKARTTKAEGIIYTYEASNIATFADNDVRCFLTGLDDYAHPNKESYITTTNCSEYIFTVPTKVRTLNVTLVAGGGGGGGAAGGHIVRHTVENANTTGVTYGDLGTNKSEYIADLLKSFRINILAQKGTDGDNYSRFGSWSFTNKSAYDGGASSSLILGFDVPFEYIKGSPYKYNLPHGDTVGSTFTIAPGSVEFANGNNKFSYILNSTATANKDKIQCKTDGTTYSYKEGICKIPSNNAYLPSEGGKADATANAFGVLWGDKIPLNLHLQGGTGGEVPFEAKGYGRGGDGDGVIVSQCMSFLTSGTSTLSHGRACSSPSHTRVISDQTDTSGKDGYASVTYSVEYPGGTGGGGGAGAVVRIKGLPVVAGERYAIYVGSGGTGGAQGISSVKPTTEDNAGKNGFGGVSTAIYKLDDDDSATLLYMVNGGAGGEGGKIPTAAEYQLDKSNIELRGRSGGNVQRIFGGGSSKILDEKVSIAVTTTNTNVGDSPRSYGQIAQLSYPKLDFEPYKTLMKNNLNTSSNYKTNVYSAFSDFRTEVGTTANFSTNGLYYRTVSSDNVISYVGGLGGHSGLGGKAGCGGYFVGNHDGRKDVAGNNLERENIATFAVNNDGTRYNVADYYENCGSSNSNGTGADLVLPRIAPIYFGQAGSGGGGGGYNVVNGPGRGGNGQDGYVMIDWKK